MICNVIEDMSAPPEGGPSACPFVAFEDDRDHRSSAPDYRHRCFAAAEPEPRAFPHQERYCLSAAFAQCPIFLDWARQEAAGVRQPGAASAGLEAGGLAAAGALGEEEEAPAFLAGRPRPTAAGGAVGSSRRSTEASASLWSYEGESKRSSSPTAPTAPSSLAAPTIAMARRGPTHPGWENPPRLENFPRLRSRDDRHSNQPLLYAAIAISLVMVALIAIPLLLNSRGGTGAGPSQSPGAGGSQLSGQSASTSPSVGAPTPGSSYSRYVVQPGDYLSKIALRYNLHLWEIELANSDITNFDHLEVGQILNIPPVGLLTQPPASPSAP